MTDEQRAAYIMAQVACALAAVAGMQAENSRCAIKGEPPTYGRKDFDEIPSTYGIHHNAVLELFIK